MKYLRGAASIGLGNMIKYLRRTTSAAANNGLGTTIKYLVNQNAGAGNNWAKAHIHKSWARVQMNTRVVERLLKLTRSLTPGQVPWSVCVWGPSILAVFICTVDSTVYRQI
jgi:hypothetical protein